MNGLLAGVWAVNGGAVALLGWTVRLLMTGRLVPRSTLDDWVAAYRISEEGRAEQATQVSELLQLARTNTAALDRIADAAATGSAGRSA